MTNEFEFDESLTEKELRLAKLNIKAQKDRESRQPFEEIVARIKAEHEAGEPERKAAYDKTVKTVEELIELGVSRESAELIARYIPPDTLVNP